MGILSLMICSCILFTMTAGKKGSTSAVSVEELRELLMESVQNTISLTALAEQQTQKMEKVQCNCKKLDRIFQIPIIRMRKPLLSASYHSQKI